jgi:tRNA-dihydrouridine synthase 1
MAAEPLHDAATSAPTVASDATSPQPKKLHGRAFYESIGSPKYVIAPMVDQSEFVSLITHAPCSENFSLTLRL